MNAVTEASMAAFANHPEGDATRQDRVQAIIGRYATLKNEAGRAAAIDALCQSATSFWQSTNSLRSN
jgi:hypothetical protein